MDLFTIAGACLRRWYITLPLLLLVGFFSYRAYASVDPLYTASRSVVVLPSLPEPTEVLLDEDDAEATAEVDNPYSGQGGSRFAVAVLARNINSLAFEERLGLDPDIEQSYEASTSAQQPMIHLTAVAPSPEAVYNLLDDVIGEAAIVLDAFQAEAGAPEITRYRIAPAVPAGPVEDATPSRMRAAAAIAVLGAGLVAAIVVGGDALLANRRRRRSTVEPGTSSAPAPLSHTEEPGPTENAGSDSENLRPFPERSGQTGSAEKADRSTKRSGHAKPKHASSTPIVPVSRNSDVYGAQAVPDPDDVLADEDVRKPADEDDVQPGRGGAHAATRVSITSKD